MTLAQLRAALAAATGPDRALDLELEIRHGLAATEWPPRHTEDLPACIAWVDAEIANATPEKPHG